MAQDIDEQETAGKGPDDLTRLVEALHPTKEEDERAERFAARLLERPGVPAAPVPVMEVAAVPAAQAAPAVASDVAARTWQRDLVMAAIGVVVGAVGTLIIVSMT